MQNYESEYKKLNLGQRQAVDATEGPLLVVAGPGTGKTQLLSMRVANILKATDTSPSSILCLTFTNKAAGNMRERLVSLIGADAHHVQVKTFHSFAADIMNENPDYFWSGAPLVNAPDAVSLGVIQDILSELPLSSPLALRYSGMYTAINGVQQGLKLAKEAGLTPEKLQALIKANLAYIDLIESDLVDILAPPLSLKKLEGLKDSVSRLPEQGIDQLITPLLSLDSVIKDSLDFAVSRDQELGKTTRSGVWKRRWIQTVGGKKGMYDERRRNEWWLNLADVYEKYKTRLNQRGFYDYADMIVEVISQLERSAELRAKVQERFLYVLIDEFQDTNAAQLRLAHLVADHETSNGSPNLMAVGDDDQSIFKFNGAELNNMLSFRKSYPKASFIVLTDNYRSTQAVLDIAKNVIEQASDRLVNREPSLHKILTAVNPPKQAGIIQHQIYPTREHQYRMLAEEISRARSKYPGQTIAVLARSHSSLRSQAAALLAQNVPVRYEQQQNIFDQEGVSQAILIAKAVHAITIGDESTLNAMLPLVLRHPLWGIDAQVLWELAAANFSQPAWLESILNHPKKPVANIGHWLMWLSGEASYQPLPVMIEYILGLLPGEYMSSPLRDYFLESRPASNKYLQTISALHRLRGLVSEFARGDQVNLSGFTEFVRLNQDNRKVITDESWFVSGDAAVELLSVHKAKGQEFDAVYIIDAVEDAWQPRRAGRKPPANLPLQPYGDDYDDYVRLMYVAVTRAKHTVIVSSFATDEAGESVLPSPLIHNIPSSAITYISSQTTINSLEQAIRWPRLETSNESHMLKARLENYQLSVTHLLNFLDVTSGGPHQFFERNLLRLPDAKSPSAAFGTAAHHAMEIAQKLVNTKSFSLGQVLTAFEESLKAQHLPMSDYDRYLAHGQQILQTLFKEHGYTLQPGSLPEQIFKNTIVGDARLSGNLDRIDIDDGQLTVVDYKTGKPLSSFETKDKNKQVKAWKHRIQLIFYTLLLRGSSRFNKSQTTNSQMVYLEADSASKLTLPYRASQAEIDNLGAIIQAVWLHINDLSFPDTHKYDAGLPGIEQFINDLLNKKV